VDVSGFAKLAVPGVDTSALAKIALPGLGTSAVLRQTIQALSTSSSMKLAAAGLDISAFAKLAVPGVDTSALAKIALRGLALDTSAWFKGIDVDLLVSAWADLLEAQRAEGAEPYSDMAVTPLSRDQIRLLWGWYVYAVVWLLILKLIIDVMSISDIVAAGLGLIVTMTGLSGNSVASRARTLALRSFDYIYPPQD
jgi:hypothetical protein